MEAHSTIEGNFEVCSVNSFASIGTKVIEIDDDIIVTGDATQALQAEKIVIIAAYFEGDKLRFRDRKMVQSFLVEGYAVFFVKSGEKPPLSLSWGNEPIPDNLVLLARSNFGYDFGSWAVALKKFPDLRRKKFVLLTNDSIVGPFRPIGDILLDFETHPSDAWAITMSNQFFPHMQSFFMGFKNSILDEKPLKNFWTGIKIQPTKMDVVMKYELGLTRLLFSEAYVVDCMYPSRVLVDYDRNPSLDAWQRLMELGFPFVKKMVIEQPESAWNASFVEEFVEREYNVQIGDWLSNS